jgi:hypothetical protein
MRGMVEGMLLGAVNDMRGATPTIDEVNYEVVAHYKGHARGASVAQLKAANLVYAAAFGAYVLGAKLGAKPPNHSKIVKSIGAPPAVLAPTLKAIGATANMKPANVIARMNANEALWANEDAWVPTDLDFKLSYKDVYGVPVNQAQSLHVVAPQRMQTPYV